MTASDATAANVAPLYPPNFDPPSKPLSLPKFAVGIATNPLGVVPETAYREPFVQYGSRFTWVTDPGLIKRILLDERDNFYKTPIGEPDPRPPARQRLAAVERRRLEMAAADHCARLPSCRGAALPAGDGRRGRGNDRPLARPSSRRQARDRHRRLGRHLPRHLRHHADGQRRRRLRPRRARQGAPILAAGVRGARPSRVDAVSGSAEPSSAPSATSAHPSAAWCGRGAPTRRSATISSHGSCRRATRRAGGPWRTRRSSTTC